MTPRQEFPYQAGLDSALTTVGGIIGGLGGGGLGLGLGFGGGLVTGPGAIITGGAGAIEGAVLGTAAGAASGLIVSRGIGDLYRFFAKRGSGSQGGTGSGGSNNILNYTPEDSFLASEAAKARKSLPEEFGKLIRELEKGNLNPGLGSKHLVGDVFYLRSRGGARLFFQKVGNQIRIVGEATKANENRVISRLMELYGR